MDQLVESVTWHNDDAWLTAGYLQRDATTPRIDPEPRSASPSPMPGAATGSWPLNLSARAFLKLPGATSVAWAVFAADWYRATYPTETAHLAGASAAAVLAFYLDTGQRFGHSPNILFDEAWHRRAYPGISALIHAGTYASAFDAYCLGGCLARSPHWLFNEAEYRRRYPDLTDGILAERGLVNGYDHYLWRGSAEGRIAHPLFDPAIYLAQFPPAQAVDGPFWDVLRRLDRREPEPRTSIYFDPAWYRKRYPTAADAKTWRWALEHYLCNDTPTRFDPNPAFSESWYLARHPDVKAMVERGEFRNGFEYFLRHGVHERDSPSEAIDLAWYAEQPAVRQDLAQGKATDAFAHWLTIGHAAGLLSAPPPDEPVTEAAGRSIFRHRARIMSVLAGRTPLDFQLTVAPRLSVIMVLRDQFTLTLAALGSLRANYPGDIELILVDCGSTDETRGIARYVKGAKRLRFDTDIGHIRACNAARVFATADTVLYLNNNTELAPGAIAAALRRLESDPGIGAVGGMVLLPNGVIQEAGHIVRKDGTTEAFLRDVSPLAPEANFVRDVDFCSGVFLMMRRDLLDRLEGFDEGFAHAGDEANAPAEYADADLCLRIVAAGYRVVYDPAVMLHHLERACARGSKSAGAETDLVREVFVHRHADYLMRRHARIPDTQIFARTSAIHRKRVLFIEDTVPLRVTGSGFVRSNDLLRLMASMGYGVTVFPLNGTRFDLAAVYADMPDTVEVMHNASIEELPGFLTQRQGYYDVIWIARTHNFDGVLLRLRPAIGNSDPMPQIVLDTEAIGSLRDAQRAALEGRAFDLDAAIDQELRNAAFCHKIVAVTPAEAAKLRALGIQDVALIGHMRTLQPTPRPFERREGILFVGAIHRMDSPNYDSLCWFVDDVLPLIEAELGWQTRLTVVGFTGDDVTLDRFRDHSRVTLRGEVPDLMPLYDAHRMFVAPTRFAAGLPYKVHEAASFGLPVVATEILRQQLGWQDGRDLLTADANDPAAFARQVVSLYRNENLWQSLRDAALERLLQENNAAHYAAAVADVLGPATVCR